GGLAGAGFDDHLLASLDETADGLGNEGHAGLARHGFLRYGDAHSAPWRMRVSWNPGSRRPARDRSGNGTRAHARRSGVGLYFQHRGGVKWQAPRAAARAAMDPACFPAGGPIPLARADA